MIIPSGEQNKTLFVNILRTKRAKMKLCKLLQHFKDFFHLNDERPYKREPPLVHSRKVFKKNSANQVEDKF